MITDLQYSRVKRVVRSRHRTIKALPPTQPTIFSLDKSSSRLLYSVTADDLNMSRALVFSSWPGAFGEALPT
jgi:hypothetical protein